MEHSLEGSLSCTCFSNPRSIDSFPRSRGARSGRPCSSRSSSRSSFHSCSTTAHPTGARAGNLAVREDRRTRSERCPAAAAEPDGEGGKREAVAGAVAGAVVGAERGRCGAVLDPRRLTVRRHGNASERVSRTVRQGVRCGADAVAFAVNADCCGALGCRTGEVLLSVTVGGKTRVLCPECAAKFVRRRSR